MLSDDSLAANLFDAAGSVTDDPVPAPESQSLGPLVRDSNRIEEEPAPILGAGMRLRVARLDAHPDPLGDGFRDGDRNFLFHERRIPQGSDRRGHADSRFTGGYLREMPIRAVVFDLFDTLVDLSMENLPRAAVRGREFPSTLGPLHEAVQDHSDLSLDDFATVLVEVDREHRVSRYEKFREFPTIERFEIVCDRLDLSHPGLPQTLTEVHMGLLRDCASLPQHHPEILGELRRRVPLALCSNFSDSATALGLLDEYGISDHLDVIVISEDVGVRKPASGIFDVVLEGLGVDALETLHVGDNLEADVGGGSGVGMQTGWLTRRVKAPSEQRASYEGSPPTYEIQDISEILDLLDAAS